MDPNLMMTPLPTTPEGWLAWGVGVLLGGSVYISRQLAERRGENRQIDRLEKALGEERNLRQDSDTKNRMLSDKINDLVQKFFEQNATNARLEEQFKHLTEQNDELRRRVAQLQASLPEPHRANKHTVAHPPHKV